MIEDFSTALLIAVYLILFLALVGLFVRQMVRLIARDTTWRRKPMTLVKEPIRE